MMNTLTLEEIQTMKRFFILANSQAIQQVIKDYDLEADKAVINSAQIKLFRLFKELEKRIQPIYSEKIQLNNGSLPRQ